MKPLLFCLTLLAGVEQLLNELGYKSECQAAMLLTKLSITAFFGQRNLITRLALFL